MNIDTYNIANQADVENALSAIRMQLESALKFDKRAIITQERKEYPVSIQGVATGVSLENVETTIQIVG